MRWLLLLAVTTACTDLPDVDRGLCGNGVVEPAAGEDCDRDDASCAACRLTCSDTAPCPAGAACGLDDLCHAPTQRFTVTADMRWTARSLLVGDTTFDRLPELVGVSDQSIAAHLGTPDGTYAASVTVPNLQVIDEPRMADLNGDGAQDLVIPLGFGLYSLAGNAFSVLQPLFQNTFSVPSVGRFVATSVNYTAEDPLGLLPGRVPVNALFAAFRLPMGPDCPVAGGCDVLSLDENGFALPGPLERLAGDELPWTWLAGEVDASLVTAVTFVDDADTPVADEGAVWLYHVDLLTEPGDVQALGRAPVIGRVRGRAWFADVDGDGRDDLLVATTNPINQNDAVSCAWGRGDGTFEPAVMLIGGGPFAELGLDPVRWGDLTGDGHADLVTTEGIRINDGAGRAPSFQLTLVQTRAWTHAQLADVDGDGRPDVIAHGSGGSSIDVLRATAQPAVWHDAPIAAPGVVQAVRAGDFDGNGAADVALVTTLPGVAASADLHVAFGTPGGGPPSPTYMGYVGELMAIDLASVLVPGALDDIDDLMVLGERGGERGAAIVLGSTSQRMIGPLIPVSDQAPQSFNVEAVIASPLDDGNATADVAALITETVAAGSTQAKVRVYASSSDGAMHQRTEDLGVPLDTSNFFLTAARWTPLPSDTRTLIAGIDLFGRTMVVPLACDATACDFDQPFDRSGSAAAGEAVALHAEDLDGDARVDLYAAFRPSAFDPGPGLTPHVRLWRGEPDTLGQPMTLAIPDGVVFVGLTAIDLDLDGDRELVALARGGASGVHLYRASASSGLDYGPFEPFAAVDDPAVDLAGGLSLTAADVNGDGLPDLVATFGPDRDAPQNLKVLVQREMPGALAATP